MFNYLRTAPDHLSLEGESLVFLAGLVEEVEADPFLQFVLPFFYQTFVTIRL